MGRLTNKVAFVTGGASGLGKGIAQRFVEEGATTIITDLNELGHGVADELGAVFFSQDVCSEDGWVGVLEEVVRRYGRLDVLVNNAGIMALPTYQTTEEGVEKQWGVNHLGHFRLTTGLMDTVMLQHDIPCLGNTNAITS